MTSEKMPYTRSDFIPASELKKLFNVTGNFYFLRKVPYRRTLAITSTQKIITSDPDLMVVMMNPGTSMPLVKTNYSNRDVPATPDPTQYKIMRFMRFAGFNHARVLNLSDLCEPTSEEFYKSIQADPHKNISSIFHPERREELNSLFSNNTPLLLAWGVNDSLIPLATLAREYLLDKGKFHFGYNKNPDPLKYYHPNFRDPKGLYNFWLNEVIKSYYINSKIGK